MREAWEDMECPFCGIRFSPKEASGACGPCGGCFGATQRECGRVCPRCGYAVFSASSGEGKTSSSPSALGPLPLTQWPPGRRARVVSLQADENSLRKLLTLGILPGVQLEVERRRPCFLCKVGRARLALDENLAACVQVGGVCADGAAFQGQ